VSAEPLLEATEHQPRARMALAAALKAGPSHAYLFRGPRGAGKRAAARGFAAEILAAASEDPADARRRVLLDPSPHPDLVWLAPSGAQHMVEEVRERVIRAAAYRPFEGGRRVFVIEAAEAMRDESQNALLKTLEEPPGFVHLILLSSEPAALLETIVSRCQPVEFAPLPVDAVEAALAAEAAADEIAAAARLSAGDVDLARLLVTAAGRKLRADAESGSWQQLLEDAEEAGADAEAAAREALEEEGEAGIKRSARDVADEAKRVGRRRRTEVLDLGLALTAAWFRDLAATAAGAPEAAFNRDRLEELRSLSAGLDPRRARRAAELVQDTRRRLDLNVSEELALEALFFRIQRGLAGGATR
jgi:DNA polymerase-3 subunit delta'